MSSPDWHKYKSVGPNADMSLGARAGLTPEKLEVELAKRRKLYAPDAGLPDAKAIREVFGFTLHGPVDVRDPWGLAPGCTKVSRQTADGLEHDDDLAIPSDII